LQLQADLYFEGVEEGCEGERVASAEGFKYFCESAMPTAAQVIDVAALIILPSMFDSWEVLSARNTRDSSIGLTIGRRVN
jgi:hypothetical protein